MMRIIDADKLKRKVQRIATKAWMMKLNASVETTLNQFIDYIDEAPSIDIVFCKECKHRPIKEDADGENYGFNIVAPERSSLCPCIVEDGWYSWMPKDNFFCGYGEREDE